MIEKRNLSMSEFASRCNISLASAYKYTKMMNIPLNVLDKIATVLDCSISDLYEQPNILETEHGTFVWDDKREQELRMLIKCIGGMSADLSDLRDKANRLLKDSVIADI